MYQPFHVLLFSPLFLFYFSSSVTLLDNFLVNCRSSSNYTIDSKVFIVNSTKSSSVFVSVGDSVSFIDLNMSPRLSNLYRTTRVFTEASRYEFGIKKAGTHFVRFHFSSFNTRNYHLKSAKTNVIQIILKLGEQGKLVEEVQLVTFHHMLQLMG